MGEVYRARDTRLDRTVAIKVLPAHLSSSPDLRLRLEREAKAVSKLSHPNICTLHDVGHQDGIDFLVMELLDGETLEERLSKGPLPPQQTIRYAAQIADALAKAHKLGITHRDLKPSNIMLTKSGAKLMDFGLAKQDGPAPLADALTEMTAAPSKLTGVGSIVGTFQYMSPEQLEGKEADARTDIFALGEVIYEMATGKPAFAGTSRASLIAAILTVDPPPITSLQPLTPPALERIVKRCLAKDPDDRWQSASDLASELKWIAEVATPSGSQIAVPVLPPRKQKLLVRGLWSLGALVLLASAFFVTQMYFTQPSGYNFRARWNIEPPEKNAFHASGDGGGPVALSPDGQRMAFVAVDENGTSRLWVRALDSLKAQPLEGTEDASYPFWSPDSRSLGFFANKQLKRIDASGGPLHSLCSVRNARGGSWGTGGIIFFSPHVNEPLYSVPATGGTPAQVTKLDVSQHDSHRWPYFLPDGKHFLYFAASHEDLSHAHDGIYVASLDGKENKLVLRAHSNAAYANGYLLFLQESALMAQPFDLRRRELTGETSPAAENVETDAGWWLSIFTASQNGALAFSPINPNSGNKLLWFDRSGKQTGSVADVGKYQVLRLSPDGQQLAVEIAQPNSDLWVYDLRQATRSQLTFGSSGNTLPVWSPDGTQIAFSSDRRNGIVDIYKKSSSGSQDEQVMLQSPANKFVLDWSPDGRSLLYLESNGQYDASLRVLPLGGQGEPQTLLKPPFYDADGRFSPDGRWIAYTSRQQGPEFVFVIPFPGPGAAKQISSTSGTLSPVWRKDGKAISYIDDNGNLIETEVTTTGGTLTVGKTHQLFKTKNNTFPYQGYPYDISRDGQRFLINTRGDENRSEITVVTNWMAGLKK